ncbi:MAG: hypothetical protein IH987_03875 [Planctomycetes bacterium]|nr:hypothetical protein [Planctomycetota bacterium]
MIRKSKIGDGQLSMPTGRSTIGMVSFLLLAACPLFAGSGGGYDLLWSSVDAGGGLSTGGGFELRGTIGQPDTGGLTGGGYSLTGGFWGIISPPSIRGDCDGDASLTLFDFSCLYPCLLGPDTGLSAGCETFDFDGDGDVDFPDFAEFQQSFGQ